MGTARPWCVPPPVTVLSGALMLWVLVCAGLVPRMGTMNGCAASYTYRTIPLAMRLQVASASGRVRSKIDGAGMVQSMQSAAVRHGSMPAGTLPLASGCAWVGAGHVMGWPSHRATRNRRLRMVGAP